MSTAKPPLILFGFMMNVVGHISAGLWRHPEDQASRYTDIRYWVEIAQLLDEAGFDALFLADALGQLDVYQQQPDAALRGAAQMPVNDPLLLVSALAAATKHLGIGVTVSTTYEHPYLLARKFTTLDHLSNGRVAWNIVTSMLDSAARNLGLTQQIPHDERYDRAQEFVDVACKLWEGSWEDDAVVRDKQAGVYSHPHKVHPIRHQGRYYQVPDAHLSEPSPQRTPVLFQAGTSARGSLFAAANAEVIFMAGLTPEAIRHDIATIRQLAVEQGRHPDALRFIAAVTVVTGPDEAQAQARYADFQRYISEEAALALFSAWTGVDWADYDPDRPLEYIETDACRSALASLRYGREYNMEIKRLIVLISFSMLTACQGAGQANKTALDAKPTEWKFNFFTPIYLPALVTFVVVQDAAGTVYRFNTLDSTQPLHDVVGEWNDSARALNGYWNHVEKPPKHIIFCWDSVIDKKVYETHLTFPWNVVDRMRKPSVHKDYLGKAAYYDSVQMGLAPGGKVAVWVNGIRFEHNYRITPSVLKTLSGDKLDICKGITRFSNGYEYGEDTKEFIKDKVYPYGVW